MTPAQVFDAVYAQCWDMMLMIAVPAAALLLLMLYVALYAAPPLVLCWLVMRFHQAIAGGHA